MYVFVFSCVCVRSCLNSENSISSLGSGVAGSCELMCALETKPEPSTKAVWTLICWAIPAPSSFLTFLGRSSVCNSVCPGTFYENQVIHKAASWGIVWAVCNWAHPNALSKQWVRACYLDTTHEPSNNSSPTTHHHHLKSLNKDRFLGSDCRLWFNWLKHILGIETFQGSPQSLKRRYLPQRIACEWTLCNLFSFYYCRYVCLNLSFYSFAHVYNAFCLLSPPVVYQFPHPILQEAP